MPIKVVLVEDEPPSLDRMKSLLSTFADIQIIGQAVDGKSAVDTINQQQPDLVFLDVQLPVFNGFEVLQKLEHKPHIIFVTAFDQYAIKAFEENAIDYLLKPISRDRLAEAIGRAQHRLQSISTEQVQLLLSAVVKKPFLQRFTIKIGDEVLFIPQTEVYYFEAKDKYIFLHTFNKYLIYDSTLKDLEKCLDPGCFIRIHKGIIVSISKIDRLKRSFNGRYKIHLKDAKKSSFEIGPTFVHQVRSGLQF
jgi:two-component system, LytTR family, response regulator LytT